MAEGNKGFISLMFDLYGSALYGIVLRVVDEEKIAKKVMEEGFLKVWKTYQHFNKEKNNLFIWLFRIFRSTAMDHLKGSNKDTNLNYSIHELFAKKNIIPQFNSEKTSKKVIDKKDSDSFVMKIMSFYKNWKIKKLIITKFMWFSVKKEGSLQLGKAVTHINPGLPSHFNLKFYTACYE